MLAPAALGNAQPWARAVTASVARVDGALNGAQDAAKVADRNLQDSITRAAELTRDAVLISDYLLTLAIVKNESRTNAIGV